MQRIISLLASGTEIVCSLGAGHCLVGRSHECDNPPWVRSLPCCTEPAFDVSVSSAAINAEVNRRLRASEPLYNVDTQRIRQLAPDLLITQSHCEVCAVTPGNVTAPPAAQLLALSAGSLEGVFQDIRHVAAAIGREDAGHALVCREQQRLEVVKQRTANLRRPSLVMLEWTDPVFAMGNWGPELVEIANGELLLGSKGQYSFAIAGERVLEVDPEYLIVAPCGYNLRRALREQPVLEAFPWWPQLRAVREGKVAFADGNLFFNRSGMTVTQTAEIIAEILHGIVFGASTKGLYWQQL